MKSRDILIEALDRLPELVHSAVDGLSPDQLRWAPAPGANPIGWLVWHMARNQDDHVAEVMGAEQVWVRDGWAPRFGLAPDTLETGYGHTAEEVARVHPESADVLIEYYNSVHARTREFLGGLTDEELDRIVDTRWDPPVTLGVRLVSVINDDDQHAGQAGYVRGLLPA
jgi:hypothetical protein